MKNKEFFMNTMLASLIEGDDFCEFKQRYIIKANNKACGKITCSSCSELTKKWLEEEYIEAVDWTKVAVDTPILVKGYMSIKWGKRYFSHFKDGRVYTFGGGCTSWSANGLTCSWENAKLFKKD
jgi:hypothetical protein